MSIRSLSKIIIGFLLFILLAQGLCIIVALNSANGMTFTNEQGASAWLGIELAEQWWWAVPILQQWHMAPSLWLGLPLQSGWLLLNIALLRLFWLYHQKVIFDLKNIQCFQFIGLLLMIWALVQVFYVALLIKLIALLQQSTQLSQISLTDSQILLFVVGLIVWAIGQVMQQGYMLQQEQDLVI